MHHVVNEVRQQLGSVCSPVELHVGVDECKKPFIALYATFQGRTSSHRQLQFIEMWYFPHVVADAACVIVVRQWRR